MPSNGVAFKIPGNGPGTGPILPVPLYSFGDGMDDYILRWDASRIADAADARMSPWLDVVQGIPFAKMSTRVAPFVRGAAGASRFVEFVGNESNGIETPVIDLLNAQPLGVTVMFVIKGTARGGIDPNASYGNNGMVVSGYQYGRAGNGAWQVAGYTTADAAASYASPAISNEEWHCAFGTAPKNSTPARTRIDGIADNGGGTVAKPNPTMTPGLMRVDKFLATGGTLQLQGIVVWPGLKTQAQMNQAYLAAQAASPLVP